MSQQVCRDMLSVRNEFNFANDIEFLFDEDDDDDEMFQTEQMQDNDNDSQDEAKLNNLDRLFTNLNNLTHEQLIDIIIPNIVSYIYHKSKVIARKVATVDEDHNKEKQVLFRFLSYIELCYEHLEAEPEMCMLEKFSSFFIFTLKVCYVLFRMRQQTTNVLSADGSMSQTCVVSQSMNKSSSKFDSELFPKLNDILTKKLPNLLERKVHGLDDLANKSIKTKLVYFYFKLNNFLAESKSLTLLLKVIDKLVIKNPVIFGCDLNEVVVKFKCTDSQLTVKSIFGRLFYLIYKTTYYHFKKMKTHLIQYVKSESKSDSDGQSNHILSLIKYGNYYLKVLNSFTMNYYAWLNDLEAYFLVTNLFGLLSLILLREPVEASEQKLIDYKIIKQDLTKKIVPKFEEMLNMFISNPSYHMYLVRTNFEEFDKLKNELVNKFRNEYNIIDTENFYEEIEYYEELALFHVIYLNKSNEEQQKQQQLKLQQNQHCQFNKQHLDEINQLKNVFELINMCSRACYLPVHFISYELFRNDFGNLLLLNDKTDYVLMEFYDFLLLNVYIYVMNGSKKQAINYLVSNLINSGATVNHVNKSLYVNLSYDVLLLITKHITKKQPKELLKFYQFLFELFEYSKTSFKTYSNAHYASFLAEVIQSSSTEMKTSLLENLKESKYFKSYSFVSSLTESSQIKMNGLVYSLDKLIMNCVKFFTELNACVEKQNLINQNLLVKLVQFIKKKNGIQLCEFLKYILDSNKEYKLTKVQIEMICKCLIEFFRFDLIENIFKLYESFISSSEQTCSIQVHENFKFIFKFVFSAISVWSKLTVLSNDSDKNVLLEILNAFSQQTIAASFNSNKIDLALTCLNFKLHLCLSLNLIINNEIKENNLRKKITEIIHTLINETNPLVSYLMVIGLDELSYDHVNTKLLTEIIRSNTRLRELFVLRSGKNDNFNESTDGIILAERNVSHIQEFKQSIKKSKEIQNNNERILSLASRDLLDDTMNAILENTTIENSQNSMDQCRQQTEKKLEQIEKDINAVINNYHQLSNPDWIKEKIEIMFRVCSDRLSNF